ncbi:hypothetical protein BDD12DRAFT_812747 [Trichophaea hybrida]|nr:hypothetical protein BDD12DRAFT_812747 [Trichophaea hybrida]
MPRSDVKITVSASPTTTVSRRRTQLRSRLELAYLEKANEEGKKITQAEMEKFSFTEESRAQVYHLNPDEVAMLRHWVYDKGLTGLGDKEKLEEIYKELGLDSLAIARRGKVDTKIVNMLRTKREHEKMFLEDDNAVMANRLVGLIGKVCMEREGFFDEFQAALLKCGMRLEKAGDEA